MTGHLPTPSRSHLFRSARRQPARGFTLVELLTVIVIIAILSAITLGVSKAVHQKKAMTKCIGDMEAICQALDQFKRDNGDYPPMDNDQGLGSPYSEQNVLMAITGHARWTTDSGTGLPKWEYVSMKQKMNDGTALPNGEKYTWGKAYVDVTQFTVDLDPSTASGIADASIIHDPWWDGQQADNAYLYRYKQRTDLLDPSTKHWQTTGFLLVSRGPDQLPELADDNFLWATVNKQSKYSGKLDPTYSDPVANPNLADNIVRGIEQIP